jgi:hypothetical protein
MPTGAYDLLGGRFTVRARARSFLLALAGGAMVATAVLGLQAVSVRAELRDAQQREKTTLDRRTALSGELQSLTGGGALTQEQVNAHLTARRALALGVAGRDPAVDQLLGYLAVALPSSITVTAVEMSAASATPPAPTASTTTTTTPGGVATPSPAPQLSPRWSVTINANATSLGDVSTFERILTAAPQLSEVTVTWNDGSSVGLTARATLAVDPTRTAAVQSRLGGAR